MKIGERIRYGLVDRYPASLTEVDGLSNWWAVAQPPDGSGWPVVKLDAGINCPATVAVGTVEERVPLVALRSSPHKLGTAITPWQDIHRPDQGYSRYFGDNKAGSGRDAHETLGNQRMLRVAELHQGERSKRLSAPPMLLFEGFRHEGRAKGQLSFVGVGVVSRTELIVQRDPATGKSFTNYRYDLVHLDLSPEGDRLNWNWINARRDPATSLEDSLLRAPKSWQKWVEGGTAVLQSIQRQVVKAQVVSDADQRPVVGSEEHKILQGVRDHYHTNKHRFEAVADFVTGKVLSSQNIQYKPGWITQGSGDGGVDFVGRIDLDPDGGFPSSRLVLLGQAKCEASTRPTNGTHIARLAARLRRGWVGSYVTTSYFSRKMQEEILTDRYPIMLIHGGRIASVLHQHLLTTGLSLDEFLNTLDHSYHENIGWGDPEQVLLLH